MKLVIAIFHIQFVMAGVFGIDDRIDRYQITNPLIREAAISSAALIPKTRIDQSQEELVVMQRSLVSGNGFCTEEKFANHLAIANCSAALIADDLVLTAGHCIDDSMDYGCDDYNIVFDYARTSDKQVKLQKKNIYNCKEIIHYDFDFFNGTWLDLAIIKLDRKVLDRRPLKVESRKMQVGEELFMVGHPLGVSQKVSQTGHVTRIDKNVNSYNHNLDTFSCNSGSPVFSKATGNIVGVLVRGSGPNYVKENGCNKWYQANEEDFHESNDLLSIKDLLRELL